MKIYKITTLIVLIILISGLMQSCRKSFIELEPKMSVTEANSYKTENDAFLAMVAVYDVLSVQNWAFIPLISNIYSDDAFKGGSNSTDMEQYQDVEQALMTAENNSALDLWRRCYWGINRANLFLEKQELIEWNDLELKKRYNAEVLFLRAYFYWDLVRHYGWVPILTQVETDPENYKSKEQNTPDEVYTQIASDLLAALADVPETLTSNEIGRVNKNIVKSLIARIYLFHEGFAKPVLSCGNWTNGTTVIDKAYATDALEDVITSGQYELLDDYAEVFSWDNQNNAESVFEFQYSEKAASDDWGGWGINGNFSVVFYGPRDPEGNSDYSSAGWSFSTCTWDLYDEFEAGDPRRDISIFNADLLLSSYTHAFQNTGYFNLKYMPYTPYLASQGQPNHNWARNYIDIRYADVLLMAAELNLETNQAKALDYLNEVRTRALGDGAALADCDLDDIYHERRVELSGEGHRKWDLLRRGLDYAETEIIGSFDIPDDVENPDDFQLISFSTDNWGMFPIPGSEIRLCNEGILKQYVPTY